MIVTVDYAFISGTTAYHPEVVCKNGKQGKWVKTTQDQWEVHIFGRKAPDYADYILEGSVSEEYVEFKYDMVDRQTQKPTPAYYWLKSKFQNMDITKDCKTLWDCLNEITGRKIDLNESFLFEAGDRECCGTYWQGWDYREGFKTKKDKPSMKYCFFIKTNIGEIEIIEFDTKDEATKYYQENEGVFVDEVGFTYRLNSKIKWV